jgi:uncharacterized protein YqeY
MLKETLYADMITAMKARESMKTEALKMIKAEIMKYETSGPDMKATDEVVMGILQKAIKQRKEAAEGFTKGGNTEMAEKEMQEAALYQAYLPAQMSAEEVKTIIAETIKEIGASGPADMGKVMAAIMPKVKGKADGKLINETVKALLTL